MIDKFITLIVVVIAAFIMLVLFGAFVPQAQRFIIYILKVIVSKESSLFIQDHKQNHFEKDKTQPDSSSKPEQMFCRRRFSDFPERIFLQVLPQSGLLL